MPWLNIHARNVLVTFRHPRKDHPTQCPSVHCVHCDIWSQGGQIVRFEHFLGRNVTAEHSVHTFLANPTVWPFVPWLHFILTYLTSIFPLKIATFHPIVTFRPFLTSHPDCFFTSLFPILWHFVTMLHLSYSVTSTPNRSQNVTRTSKRGRFVKVPKISALFILEKCKPKVACFADVFHKAVFNCKIQCAGIYIYKNAGQPNIV